MDQSYAIIGAAMAVHSALGPGFHEVIYHQALSLEFEDRGIAARPEVQLPVFCHGRQLGATYRVDFLCYDAIVVELKVLVSVGGQEAAQLLNYLKATLSPRPLAKLRRSATGIPPSGQWVDSLSASICVIRPISVSSVDTVVIRRTDTPC